jgi:cytochrome c553
MSGRKLWLAALLLAMNACASAPAAGDPARGQALFNQPVAGSRGEVQACVRCHAVEKDAPSPTGLGTNFYSISIRAESEVPGQSAAEYLRIAIIDPDAHLAGGFQDGLMFRGYATALTEQQIADLVAYMQTLRGAP